MQSKILPSRQALVDRIELQFEYGQNLIALVGRSGLGKSYIAETFITDKYPEYNKAFITLSANTAELDVIRSLLEHSFRSPLIDQKLSLSENFYMLHSEQACGPCLWVIDGAKHLTKEMLDELQILAKNNVEQLHILLTVQSPNLVPEGLDIHIEPLSLNERRRLMGMYFPNLPDDEDPIFSTFLNDSHGNPSILLEWQSTEQRLDLGQTKLSAFQSVPWRWYAIFSILLMCSVMIAWLYQAEITQKFTVSESTPVDTVVQFETNQDERLYAPEVKPVANGSERAMTGMVIENDNTVDQEQSSHDVAAIFTAITNKESKALIAEEQSLLKEKTSGSILLDSTQEANVKPRHSVSKEEKQKDREDLSDNLIAGKEQLSLSKSLLDDTNWFLAQQDSAWIIQLLAVTDESIARAFIIRYQDIGPKLYHVKRGDRIWWIVNSPSFETIQQARKAQQGLPESLKQNKPFFKELIQIKREIRNARAQTSQN